MVLTYHHYQEVNKRINEIMQVEYIVTVQKARFSLNIIINRWIHVNGEWCNVSKTYVEYWLLFDDSSNCLVVEDMTDDCSDNDTADNNLMTKWLMYPGITQVSFAAALNAHDVTLLFILAFVRKVTKASTRHQLTYAKDTT